MLNKQKLLSGSYCKHLPAEHFYAVQFKRIFRTYSEEMRCEDVLDPRLEWEPSKKYLNHRKGRSHESSVGIATRYGMYGPGIESRWGRDFPLPSRPALWPTQPPIQWVPGLSPGVKRPGCDTDHPPHLAPRLKKE